MVPIGDVAQFKRHADGRLRERRSATVIKRKVGHVSGLLGRREDIVDRAHAQDELLNAGQHSHDDQLGGDELSERDLSVDDQLRAEDQKAADNQCAEDDDGDRLLLEHLKVLAAVHQVTRENLVHALHAKR